MPLVFDVYCDNCNFEGLDPVATLSDKPSPGWCPACDNTGITRVLERWLPEPGVPYRLHDLEPMRDRLIVAPLPVPSRTKGGIHLAETGSHRERPQHGLVLKTGPDVKDAHVGDCVFYGKYSGQVQLLADREVLNMAEIELFARLPKGAFVLVEHVEDAKFNHLEGDYCDLCASPDEQAAAAALEEERRRLVEGELGHVPPAVLEPLEAQPAPSADLEAKSALEQERERVRAKRREAEAQP